MSRPYPKYRDSGVEWLGEVPEHWEVEHLGRVGTFSKGGGGTKDDEVEGGIPCVRYGDLYTQHEFCIRGSRAGIAEASTDKYRLLHYGEVLFAGSGETIEEIGKSAVSLIEGRAYCGGDVIVFTPSVDMDATFLGYASDCRPAAYQKACMGRGVTVMHIYSSELKRMLVPFPPVGEQSTIAEFLDRQTSKIDTLVERKRLLIERLSEYRTALITRTVTRGLPPAEAEAAGLDPNPPMKDSGVEWLGEVPEHWGIMKLGAVLNEMVGGGTPSTTHEEYWADEDAEGLPWVAIGDMSDGGEVLTTAKRVTDAGITAARLRILPPETIIYSMYASVGAVARLGIHATTNQAILGLRSGSGVENPFLYWWLTAIRKPVLALTRDNTQSNLNAETVRQIPIVIPPRAEQATISGYLNRKTAEVDSLCAHVEGAIERLLEYRTALVTAAVTGKIDVRGAVDAEMEVCPV